MKLCSTSYVIIEMQIKTMRYHYMPIEMAKIQSTDNVHKRTWTQMFIAALFMIAKTWKQPRYPSAGKWINNIPDNGIFSVWKRTVSVFTDESQVPRTIPGTQFLLDKYFLIEWNTLHSLALPAKEIMSY